MLPWRQVATRLLLVLLLLGVLSCRHAATARPAPAASPALHHRHRHGAAPRHSLEHLQGAGRGSHVAGLAEVKRYLARFGYMDPRAAGEHDDDAFDEHMEAAVKRYQSRLGLPVTGRLDAATLGRVVSPRCGVGDGHVSVTMSESTSGRFTFFDGEPRWTQADPLVLTYSISSSEASVVDDLPPEAVSAALRSAFARWARVIPVEFVEAEADDYYDDDHHQADIKVGFYVGDHGDGSPFDGKDGLVAHAYAPKDGRLHFDAAESWAVDVGSETPASWAMDLETVAVHEIGHILGLGHSSSPGAVMFPYVDIGERKVELSVDDIEGVQLLYGSNPLFSHPSSSVRTGRGGWLAGSVSFVGAVLAVLVTHV